MLKAYFHNDGVHAPHVHIVDVEEQMDVRPPIYSKKELRDWIYETETFNIHMCNMIGLPISL